MGVIWTAPVSENQVRENVKTIQNETALTDIRDSIRAETSNRDAADNALRQDLSALRGVVNEEITQRTNDDTALREDLNTEETRRTNADNQLQANLDTEIDNRNKSETKLRDDFNKALDDEKRDRQNADTDLKNELLAELGSETALRETADNNLRLALNSETTFRIEADRILDVAISAEAQSRTTEDGKLSDALEVERKARADADADLKNELLAELESETTLRIAIDEAIVNVLTSETAIRTADIAKLSEDIFNEVTARTDADKQILFAIQSAINSEAAARASTVDDLQQSLANVFATYAPIDSPNFTGAPKVPNIQTGANNLQAANKYYVDTKFDGVSSSLNVFSKNAAGFVPQPPDSNDEQILVANKAANLYGWRSVKSSTVFIDDIPAQTGSLTYELNRTQTPTWINYDTSKLKIGGTTSAADAGTYTATFTPLDLYVWGSDNTQSTKNSTWTINKRSFEKPRATQTEFTYRPEGWAPNIVNVDAQYMTQGGTISAVAQGTYTATYTLNSTKNTQWADGSSNPVNITWKINKMGIEKPQLVGSSEIDYKDGAQVSPNINKITAGYVTQVGTDTATAVGAYTAIYRLTDPANTQWADGSTADVQIPWSVVQKNLPAEFSSGFEQTGTLTYSGSRQSPTISHFSSTYHTITGNAGTDAGTYTAYISPISGYTWADGTTAAKSVSWKIDPQGVAPPKQTQASFDYTGNAYDFTRYISGYDSSKMNRAGDTSGSEAKTYSTTFTLKNPSGKTNYVWSDDNSTRTVTLSWSIGKRTLTAEQSTGFAQVSALTFNGGTQNLTASNISNFSTSFHVLGGTTSASDAGTYTATVAPVAGYTWADGTSAPKNVTWTINAQVVYRPSAPVISFVTDGNTHFIDDSDHYDPLLMTRSGTTTPQSKAGEYTTTYTLRNASGKKNYIWDNGTYTAWNIDWAIGLRLLKIPEANIVEPYVYAEPPNNSKTLVVKNLDTDWQDYIEVRSDSVMTASDAGTYTAYYHIKDVSKATWSDKTTADKAVQWTINRKPLTAKQSEFAGTYTEEFTFSYQYNGEGYVAVNYTADVKEFSSTVFDSRYHEISGTTSTTGTGTFTVTITPAANYCWNDGTVTDKEYTWKVNRLPVKVTGVTLKEQTSGGIWVVTSQPITYDGQPHGSLAYYQIEPSSARLDVREVTSYEGASAGGTNLQRQAGKYIVEKTLSSGNFPFKAQCILYIGAEEKAVNKFYLIWEIARAPIDAVNFRVTGSYVYDTTEQTVTIGGYSSKTMTISGNKATAAGTYTALITPDANHCWSDGTTDAKEVEWTIQPKQIDLPTAAEVDFPYDKTAHALEITGYQPTYMTQSGTASATNAGSYAVTFTLKDTVNTAWATGSVEPYSIEWSIGLSKVEIPTAKTTAFTFSEGVLREPVFENVDTANVTMSGDVSATNAKDGSYTVIFSLKDTETTVWSDGTSSPKSYRWTIARKKLTAAQSTFTFAGTLNYSGSSWNVTSYISGYNSNYHSIGGQIVQTNADTYTAQIQPLSNYQWQEGGYGSKPVIWKIEPIEIAKPEITDTLPIEYDNKSHTPTVVNYNSSYMTRAGDYGAKTAAGDYQITYTLKNTNNTTWTGGDVEPVKLSWSIEKKMVTIPTAITTVFTYGGGTKTLAVKNPDSDYCIQADGTVSAKESGNYSVTYQLKNPALTAWADGTTTDKTINWVINKAVLSVVYSNMRGTEYTYNGSERFVFPSRSNEYQLKYYSSTGSAGSEWVLISLVPYYVTLSGDTAATDAGEYTLYLTPTANYIWSDGTQTARPVTWRIKPAKIFSSSSTKVSVSTTTPIIANGTAQSPTLNNYDPEKMDLGGDVSKTEKGEYVITVTPKSNYCWYDNSQTALEFDWRIVKNVYTVPAPNSTSLVFDGTTQAPFEYDTEKILGTNISASDAGTYTATFALADTVSCEWADGTTTPKTVSWTIAPVTLTAPTVDGTVKLVYNSAAQLAKSTLLDYDSTTMTLGGTTRATDAGVYTATVTPKTNYSWVGGSTAAKSFEWTIHRQALTNKVGVSQFVACSLDGSDVAANVLKYSSTGNSSNAWAVSGYREFFTTTGLSASSIGAHQATLSLKPNYCWEDETTADKTFTWYIRKRFIVRPVLTSSQGQSVEYTGNTQQFYVDTPSAFNGALQQSQQSTGVEGVAYGNHLSTYWEYITLVDNSFETAGQYKMAAEPYYRGYSLKAKDAGEYYAKFAINDHEHHCWKDTWSEDNPAGDSTPYTMYFYIGTAGKEIITPPELVEGAPTEVPYNGGAWNYLDLYVFGYDSTTMTASSSTSATNAGTYTLKIDLKDKTNTVWRGGGTATKTFTWKITPTLLEKPTVAKTELEYNGKEQALKISGFDSNTMSQTGTASATNVTSTSVTFALKDKTNYRWADGTTANVVISWKIVAASLPKPIISSATSFEYSGAAKSVTVKNYDTSLMTATGYLSGTAADTYTVTFALRNKTYSKWEDGTTADVTLNWEITPKKLTLEQSTLAQATPIPTYTGSEITVTITNFSASYHEYSSETKATNAGTYYAVVKPRENYCWNNGTTTAKRVKWTIARVYIEPPTADVTSFEYTGGEINFLANYVTGYDSTIMKVHTGSGSYAERQPKATNVGEYRLWLELNDAYKNNYSFVAEYYSSTRNIPWQITPKYVDKPSADVTSFTYCGEEQSLTVTGYDSTTMTASGTTAASDAGTYTATYALKDKTNYRWTGGVDDTADVAISWEIKKLGTLPLPGGSNFGTYRLTNYTGSVQTPEIKLLMKYFTSTGQWGTVTGTNTTTAVKDGEVQSAILKWYNVTGDFSGTNAGDYTISFTPNKNCTWGSGGTEARTLTWTINKASQTITLAKTSVTLNDDNIQSTVTITAAGGGTVSVTSGDTNIVTASYGAASQMITLTAKQNGTATVTVKQAGNENYNAATNKVITVKVDRSIESLTWTEIQTYAKNGTLLKYGEIGDTKKLKIQGTVGTLSVNDTYAAVLIGYNHNADIEGNNRAHFAICKDKNGADFVFTDSSYNTRISSTNANVDKYFTISKNGSSTPAVFSNSAAADRLGEFLTAFPSTLQNVITACTKHSRGLVSTYISSGKKVWTLSITEIGGSNAPYVNAKCEQYEYFANGNDINASSKKFWLRDHIGDASVGIDWGSYQGSQTFAATGPSYSLGIVPCFTIS